MCALLLWRSGLGLVMSKFRPFVTELSAHDMIMMEYYSLTFLFVTPWCGHFSSFPLEIYLMHSENRQVVFAWIT